MDCSTPGFPSITNSQSLLKLMPIESVMPSNHLILCHPFLLLPSIFPSIRVFSNESVLRIRWQQYRSFSFSFSASNEYSGMISFRMDWFDLLAVQGTLKSSPTPQLECQHHSQVLDPCLIQLEIPPTMAGQVRRGWCTCDPRDKGIDTSVKDGAGESIHWRSYIISLRTTLPAPSWVVHVQLINENYWIKKGNKRKDNPLDTWLCCFSHLCCLC